MFGRSESIDDKNIEFRESIDYLKTCIHGLYQIPEEEFTKILEGVSIHGLLVRQLNLLVGYYIIEHYKK